MLSYTEGRTLYGDLTNNDDSTNLTIGDRMINLGIRKMLGSTGWPFLEASTTVNTVASQQFYDLPYNYNKLNTVTIDIGTTRFRPDEVPSRKRWDEINATTGIENDVPSYFFIENSASGATIGFWGTPATADNTININYKIQVRDLSIADYTTGTITTIANDDTTVTGNGTTWTSQMAGRFIRITHLDTVNTGDGYWYEIASVTNTTTLELSKAYQGTAIATGSAVYTIAQTSVIPEDYQEGPVFYAAYMYWLKEDNRRAAAFKQEYDELLRQMQEDLGNKTTDPSIDSPERDDINPNLTVWAT